MVPLKSTEGHGKISTEKEKKGVPCAGTGAELRDRGGSSAVLWLCRGWVLSIRFAGSLWYESRELMG